MTMQGFTQAPADDSVEALSWRTAILLQWESRLQLLEAVFVWIQDLSGRFFLHDARNVLVQTVSKLKAFEEMASRNELALNSDRIFDTEKLKLDPKSIEEKKQKMSRYHSLMKSAVGPIEINIPCFNLEENAEKWAKLRPGFEMSFEQLIHLPANRIRSLLQPKSKFVQRVLPGSRLRKKKQAYDYRLEISDLLKTHRKLESPKGSGRSKYS